MIVLNGMRTFVLGNKKFRTRIFCCGFLIIRSITYQAYVDDSFEVGLDHYTNHYTRPVFIKNFGL